MPVTSSLLGALAELYESNALDGDNAREAMVQARPEAKMLVDTIFDQVIAKLLGVDVRNAIEARRAIATHSKSLNEEDQAVLRALDGVLGYYDQFKASAYVDNSTELARMFLRLLPRLCIALTNHPSHSSNPSAVRLRVIVGALRT